MKLFLRFFIILFFPIAVVNAQSNKAYITNFNDDFTSVIDLQKMEVIGEINMFGFPRVPVITNDGKTIYSTLRWLNGVLKIDTEKNKVVDWIQLPQSKSFPQEGKASHGPGIHPDGKYLYLTSQILNSPSIIDIESQNIVKGIAAVKVPNFIDFTKDSKTAIVSNTADNTASVIDCTTNKVIAKIPAGKNPKRLVAAK